VSATSPVRFPDTRSRVAMTRRAWWLIILNALLPGSAQLLAGSRRLGRFGVGSTFVLWVAALILLLVSRLSPGALVGIGTNLIALSVIQGVLLFYALLWIVLTLDALRLLRLVKTAPGARLLIGFFTMVALVLVVGGAGYGVVVAQSARGLVSEVFSYGDIEPAIDGRYNFLLLGGDAGPDRLGLRPDSISVVSVDAVTGAASIIGIPRNLERAPFVAGSPMLGDYPNGYDCGDNCLVSYLYTYGQEHPDLYPGAEAAGSTPGTEAMRDAVEGITGLTLQYYVLIDMQGFGDLIDALGGVTIDVPSRLPLGINGGEVIGHIEAGKQRMSGTTALWYARTRYEMTDYDRMVRQRQVQEAILAQFEPANVLARFQGVAAAGAQVVKTDIPQSMLAYFVDLSAKTRAIPVGTFELIPDNGVDVVYPNYPDIQARIAAELARATAESTTPTPAN
jgi:LCP family protein required for cell wall assembly